MSKIKNFCKNVRRKSKAKSAKKRVAKLEKKMYKLAKKADKICRNENDYNVFANIIFDMRDYQIHMSKYKPHTYRIGED